jgi:hypothetical protein
MVLDPSKIAVAVSSGLSIVCATCEKYWEARDKNVPDDRCLATDGCGSPIAGDTFHEYRGPMTQFDQFCFRCGDKATHAIRVNNSVRVIGCCSEHVEMVKTLKPTGQRAQNIVLISKDGEKQVAEDAPPEKRPLILKMRG